MNSLIYLVDQIPAESQSLRNPYENHTKLQPFKRFCGNGPQCTATDPFQGPCPADPTRKHLALGRSESLRKPYEQDGVQVLVLWVSSGGR